MTTLATLFNTWKEHTTVLGRLAAQYRKAAGRWSDGSFIVELAKDAAKQRNRYALLLSREKESLL